MFVVLIFLSVAKDMTDVFVISAIKMKKKTMVIELCVCVCV